ncbi:MAG: DUF460 domain-containing protein [Candidatus Burarchaeum sp.]|nr:DUF460 domain-containing protein [Candidatus Burarchaeum sp.]MDO8339127.1 DUF460 domain-containing protein [Candidatus Burarchaeum sp.]
MIVGIDPGTTIAIAAVDLKGRLVGSWSGRDEGKASTLVHMRRFGMPCLFAADVARAPDTVAKLSASCNTRLFTPPRDMTQAEKLELAKDKPHANEHELDAIAAALRAYHHHENKFRLIDREMAEQGLEARADEVKKLAINGLSVHQSLLLFAQKEEAKAGAPAAATSHAESKRNLAELSAELISLANSNIELRKALERLEREKAELEARVRELERSISIRLRRDNEIRHRDRTIASLREQLTRHWRKKEKKPAAKSEPRKDLPASKSEARKDLKALGEKQKSVDLDTLVDTYRHG